MFLAVDLTRPYSDNVYAGNKTTLKCTEYLFIKFLSSVRTPICQNIKPRAGEVFLLRVPSV